MPLPDGTNPSTCGADMIVYLTEAELELGLGRSGPAVDDPCVPEFYPSL